MKREDSMCICHVLGPARDELEHEEILRKANRRSTTIGSSVSPRTSETDGLTLGVRASEVSTQDLEPGVRQRVPELSGRRTYPQGYVAVLGRSRLGPYSDRQTADEHVFRSDRAQRSAERGDLLSKDALQLRGVVLHRRWLPKPAGTGRSARGRPPERSSSSASSTADQASTSSKRCSIGTSCRRARCASRSRRFQSATSKRWPSRTLRVCDRASRSAIGPRLLQVRRRSAHGRAALLRSEASMAARRVRASVF